MTMTGLDGFGSFFRWYFYAPEQQRTHHHHHKQSKKKKKTQDPPFSLLATYRFLLYTTPDISRRPEAPLPPSHSLPACFYFLCPRFSLILSSTSLAALVMRVPGPKMAQAPA